MPTSHARQPVMTQVTAIVTRADGTVEDLGVIAFNHQNPLRRWAWRLKQYIRGRKPGRIRSN